MQLFSNHKRLLAMILASGMLLSSMTGCAQTAPDSTSSGAAVNSAATVLELKKPSPAAGESPRILILGNSYISSNDLPGVFNFLSQEGGYSPEVMDYTDGAYRLSMFVDSDDGLGAMAMSTLEAEGPWDFVILQEESLVPTIVDSRDKEMYPAARALDSMIKGANGQTVFMEAWPFKNGGSLDDEDVNIDKNLTREQMQTQIYQANAQIAKELDALLSPVGSAFMRSMSLYPKVELWSEDMMDPSEVGTYLAACVLYCTIYDKSPVGLEYYDILDEDIAIAMQHVAADVVFGTNEAVAADLSTGDEEEPDAGDVTDSAVTDSDITDSLASDGEGLEFNDEEETETSSSEEMPVASDAASSDAAASSEAPSANAAPDADVSSAVVSSEESSLPTA